MPMFLEKRAFRNLMAICGLASAGSAKLPAGGEDKGLHRCTPDEARKRRKAYKRRKAAKAARRRNRK